MKHDDFKQIAADPQGEFALYQVREPMLTLQFDGKIVPKERPRTGKNGHVYTPARTRKCEEAIAKLVPNSWRPYLCPVAIEVTIYEEPPKWAASLSGDLLKLMAPKKGDLDNKVKTITDALNGLAYRDDDQISQIQATRRYARFNRAFVTIRRIGISEHEARQIAKFL